LTRLYERCGNIAAPVVFHALFNLANVALILLFPDSAGPPHTP
jgi:membrane protease YdiL (CAAX protease family)